MITVEDIKNKREEYKLTQANLANAIKIETYSYGRMERQETAIDLETLESIANVYGCTIEMVPIENNEIVNNSDFYNKSIEEIIKMDNKDIVNYILINYDNSIIARVCNTTQYILSLLDSKKIRTMLEDVVEIKSKRVLYHILKNTFGEKEEILLPFIDVFNDYLREETHLEDKIIEKIHYVEANWEYCDDCYYEGWTFENLKFLDKDGNDLNIPPEDAQGIPIDDYFQDWLKGGIGNYLEEYSRLQIKGISI